MNQNIKRKSTSIYSKLVTFFLILTIVAILVIVHFALAKTEIKLYNNVENQEVSVLVEMQSEENQDLASDAIRGKIIKTELELSTSVASSQEMTNSAKAGGYVTIYNNYSKSQPLVKTTRLLSPDNKLFRITEGVTIPAGGQVEVWAEADEDGEEFITEATTFIIPGLWEGLQDIIYAESFDGMKLQSVPNFVVTEENLSQAKEKIKEEAIQKSLANINELVGEKLAIGPKRLRLEFETISSNQIGDISKDTELTQKITAYGLVFDEASLLKVAEEKFAKELKGGQVLIDFSEDAIDYDILEINTEKEEAIIEIKTEATISSSENIWDINKDDLVGKNETELREYLQQFNPEKVDIKFSPFWVKTVPPIKDHIIIE